MYITSFVSGFYNTINSEPNTGASNRVFQGATVRTNADQQIVISRVLQGGAASRSGMLHQGDVMLEINGQSVQGWSIDEVAKFMVRRREDR